MASPFQGDDTDYFETARDKEGNVKQTGLSRTAKLSSFGAAFNAARKAGQGTFMYKGKKYTTEMAKPKASAKVPIAAAPAKAPAAAPAPKSRSYASSEDIGAEDSLASIDATNKMRGIVKDMADKERMDARTDTPLRKGGKVKKMAAGGSASRRGDGCAVRGKTKGRMV